jgi:hypothetical protein
MHNIRRWAPGWAFPLVTGTIIICLVFGISGCGGRKTAANKLPAQAPEEQGAPAKIAATETASLGSEKGKTGQSEVEEFEKARAKHIEVTKSLEEASRMLKSGNLEGSLRLVQRIQQENREDPFVSMQTNYLQAMVFHRQRDPVKRKAAMNEMLRSMETAQKDPRFQKSFEEGMAGVEIIRESLKRHSKQYESN